MMTASYLETLSTFSPEVLAESCDGFKRRSTRFAPSAGEIYDRCSEIQDKVIKFKHPKLERPEFDYPEKHRTIMQSRWDDLIRHLKEPEDLSCYEVPRGTKPAKPVVTRHVPASFMDQWEREHGRLYPARDRVLVAVKNDYREAAE